MPMLSTPDSVLANSQHDGEVPFEWRGGVNDALYQATVATNTFQIQKLKRSIIRYFILSLAIPCIALLLISLAIFFSTGFQFYACFIVLLFLAFLIIYRVMWLTRLLRAIRDPDTFYQQNSSNILIEPSSLEAGEIQVLPQPPPTYDVAQRSPPTYELYKWSDVNLMAHQSQTDFNRANIPAYENVAQVALTQRDPPTSRDNIAIRGTLNAETLAQERNSNDTVTLQNYQNQNHQNEQNNNTSGLRDPTLTNSQTVQLTHLDRVYRGTNNQTIIN